MVIASGTRAKITYVEEVTRGVTPTTPTLKTARLIDRDINLEAAVLESEEVRPDRQISDSRQGFNRDGGSLRGELSNDSHDDFIRLAMSDDWYSVAAQGTFGTDRDTNAITRASGSWIDDGFLPGMMITTSGHTTAATNATHRVISVAALSLVIDFDITVSDTGGGDERVWLAGTGAVTSSGTFESVNATSRFTRATGSFLTDGWVEGMAFTTAGMGQSATLFVVTAVATDGLSLTVSPAPINDTGDADEVMTSLAQGRIIRVGTTLKTLTVERQHEDIGVYEPFEGVCMNTMGLDYQPGRLVGITFGLLGMTASEMDTTSISASPANDPPSTFPYSVFVGELYEAGVSIALVTGLTAELDNGRSLVEVLFSKTSPDVFEGTARWTGTMRALFQDRSLAVKFRNETETSVWMRTVALNGTDFINVAFPRVKYNAANLAISPQGPTIMSLPFRALVDSVSGTSAWIQISNAVTS